MKKSFLYIAFIALTFNLSTVNAQTECDSRVLKNELYNMLKPDYRYDKSKVTEVTIKNVSQGGEIGVPILSTEKYRLLFNTAGFPTDVEIRVYDKAMGEDGRQLLYSIEEEKKAGKTVFMFKPSVEHFKTIYIDYVIPAVTDDALLGQKGCIVFLMGYKVG